MELGLTTACLGISLEDVGPPTASLRGVWQRLLSNMTQLRDTNSQISGVTMEMTSVALL